MNKYEELANLLLPNVTKEVSYFEEKYKARELKEGEVVTRFAPSPTGFVHLGSLYGAMVNRIYTDTNGGVFYLRIERLFYRSVIHFSARGIE